MPNRTVKKLQIPGSGQSKIDVQVESAVCDEDGLNICTNYAKNWNAVSPTGSSSWKLSKAAQTGNWIDATNKPTIYRHMARFTTKTTRQMHTYWHYLDIFFYSFSSNPITFNSSTSTSQAVPRLTNTCMGIYGMAVDDEEAGYKGVMLVNLYIKKTTSSGNKYTLTFDDCGEQNIAQIGTWTHEHTSGNYTVTDLADSL